MNATAREPTPLVAVDEAVRLIGSGGVIAYPTEAVFGLGCNPSDPDALARVLAAKGRAPDKGFILVAASARQLAPWLAPLEPAWRSRMNEAWPGPVTFVVPAARDTPALVRGGRLTLAVRVSDHPIVRALCDGCGHPLVSTSANTSGKPALRNALAVARAFGSVIDGVVAGETGGRRRATPIVDVRTGRRLRD